MTLLRSLGLLFGLPLALLSAAGVARAQDLPEPEAPTPQPVSRVEDGPTMRLLRSLRDLDVPMRQITWTGSVTNAKGEPVAGADVWFLPDGETLLSLAQQPNESLDTVGLNVPAPDFFEAMPLTELPQAQTDAAGRYELRGPWRYQRPDGDAIRFGPVSPLVVIAKEGYATQVDDALVGVPRGEWLPDVVPVGESRLLEGMRLHGHVVDQRGKPVESAYVRVERTDPDAGTLVAGLHDTTTDHDGAFELDGLGAGQVKLLVSRPDRGRVESEWIAINGNQPVHAEIRLPKGVTVSGVVCDTSGRPIGGAHILTVGIDRAAFGLGCITRIFEKGDDPLLVQLAQRVDENGLTTIADASGTFSLAGQWGGPITLYAEAPGFEPVRLPRVQLGAEGLRVEMQPSATLALQFVDAESGQPLRADHVRAYRRGSGDAHRTEWDRESDFALPVSAETGQGQRWVIDHAGRLGTFLFVTAPGHASSTCKLPGMKLGEQLELTLPLARALRCEGRVSDEHGVPIAGACVDLTEPGQHLAGIEAGALTDAEGRFAFDTIAEGAWDVVVKAPDWIEAVREKVVLSSAAAPAPVIVLLWRGGTIHATVDPATYAQAGRPEIALDGLPAGQPDARGYGRFSRPYAQADAQGVVEFHGVPPGVHRLTLGERTVDVTVVASQTVEVSLGASEPR